jgi:hypothetical protein
MKNTHLCAALFTVFVTLAASAALPDVYVPFRWTVNTARPARQEITINRGETIALEPTYQSYDGPINLTNVTEVLLRYRSSDMPVNTYYAATGSVVSATGGVVRILWGPEHETTNSVFVYDIKLSGANSASLKASGSIRLAGAITGVSTNQPTIESGYIPINDPTYITTVALASNAVPKTATNGWEVGSHAALVATNDPAYQNLLTNTATKAQGELADLALLRSGGTLTGPVQATSAATVTLNASTGDDGSRVLLSGDQVLAGTARLMSEPDQGWQLPQTLLVSGAVLSLVDGVYYLAYNRETALLGRPYYYQHATNTAVRLTYQNEIYWEISVTGYDSVYYASAGNSYSSGPHDDAYWAAYLPEFNPPPTVIPGVQHAYIDFGLATLSGGWEVSGYVPTNRLLIVNGVTNDFTDDIEITVESGGGVDTNAVLDLIDLADRDPYLIPYAASVTIAPSNGVLQAITNITGNLTLLWDTSSSNVDSTVLLLLPPTTNTVTLGQSGYEYSFVSPLASGGQNVSTNTVTELIMRKPYSTTNATVLVRQQGSSPAPFSPSNLSTDYADDYATLVKTDTAAYVNLLTNTATKAQGERADLALTDDTNYAKLGSDNEFTGTNTFAAVVANVMKVMTVAGFIDVPAVNRTYTQISELVYADGDYQIRGTFFEGSGYSWAVYTNLVGVYVYLSAPTPNAVTPDLASDWRLFGVPVDGTVTALDPIALLDTTSGRAVVNQTATSDKEIVNYGTAASMIAASVSGYVVTNHTGDVSISGKLTAGSYPAKQTPYFLTGTNITVSADYMLQAITNITGATTINWPAGDATADMWISLTLPATTNTITLGSTNWVSYTFVSPLTSGGNNVGTNRPTRMILEQVHGSTNATVTVTESR